MGVRGASAAYSRPTSTTKQSHKSQLNSVVHKRKMSFEYMYGIVGNYFKRMQGDTI